MNSRDRKGVKKNQFTPSKKINTNKNKLQLVTAVPSYWKASDISESLLFSNNNLISLVIERFSRESRILKHNTCAQ